MKHADAVDHLLKAMWNHSIAFLITTIRTTPTPKGNTMPLTTTVTLEGNLAADPELLAATETGRQYTDPVVLVNEPGDRPAVVHRLGGRVKRAWSWMIDMARWWANKEVIHGVTRSNAIASRARLLGRTLLVSAALVMVWLLVGPWIVRELRAVTHDLASASSAGQDVMAVGVVAVAIPIWRVARATRRPNPALTTAPDMGPTLAALSITPVRPAIARHEAAHAVVAHVLGAKVLSVRAIPMANTAGRCAWVVNPGRPAADSAWISLCALTAGQLEEPPSDDTWPGASSDARGATDAATFLVWQSHRPAGYDGPATIEGFLTGARDHARQVLSEHRATVDALTAHLIDKRAIYGEELRALLGDGSLTGCGGIEFGQEHQPVEEAS